MGLVHDAEHNLVVVGVLSSQLAPQASKLLVGGTALANDLAVPSSVVVNVKDTHLSDVQAALHQVVVGTKVRAVEGTTKVVVDQVLPTNWQAEGVKPIIIDEVLHLGDTIVTWVAHAGDRAGAVRRAAEVKASNVHTSVLHSAGR